MKQHTKKQHPGLPSLTPNRPQTTKDITNKTPPKPLTRKEWWGVISLRTKNYIKELLPYLTPTSITVEAGDRRIRVSFEGETPTVTSEAVRLRAYGRGRWVSVTDLRTQAECDARCQPLVAEWRASGRSAYERYQRPWRDANQGRYRAYQREYQRMRYRAGADQRAERRDYGL